MLNIQSINKKLQQKRVNLKIKKSLEDFILDMNIPSQVEQIYNKPQTTDEEYALSLQEEENYNSTTIIGGNQQQPLSDYILYENDEDNKSTIVITSEFAKDSPLFGLKTTLVDSTNNTKNSKYKTTTVGKGDKRTFDKVLDKRTQMILYKLMNNGILDKISGSVSSGKESHVFCATGPIYEFKEKERKKKHDNTTEIPLQIIQDELKLQSNVTDGSNATLITPTSENNTDNTEVTVTTSKVEEKEQKFCVKVFKTVGMSYRKRVDYQVSEYRFKENLKSNNSQKNVKKYAEKELKNLKKLYNAGIPCPQPFEVKEHVLLMSFIGKNGFPAPTLKDSNIYSLEKLRMIYIDVIENMRKMYQKAHLIHSDLSEYNILYFKNQIYFIDVSQAVETNHINAKQFLKDDCKHVNEYFKKQGLIHILTDKELFEYTIKEENVEESESLESILESLKERDINLIDQTKDEEYFINVFLPKSSMCTHELYDSMEKHFN
ncbi:hypothetical protein ABK040_003393 [Willaertia magna]